MLSNVSQRKSPAVVDGWPQWPHHPRQTLPLQSVDEALDALRRITAADDSLLRAARRECSAAQLAMEWSGTRTAHFGRIRAPYVPHACNWVGAPRVVGHVGLAHILTCQDTTASSRDALKQVRLKQVRVDALGEPSQP